MTEPRDSKITLTYSSKWNDMSSRSGFEWGESLNGVNQSQKKA